MMVSDLNCSTSKQITYQRKSAFLGNQMRQSTLSDLKENSLRFWFCGQICNGDLKKHSGLVNDVGICEHVIHLKWENKWFHRAESVKMNDKVLTMTFASWNALSWSCLSSSVSVVTRAVWSATSLPIWPQYKTKRRPPTTSSAFQISTDAVWEARLRNSPFKMFWMSSIVMDMICLSPLERKEDCSDACKPFNSEGLEISLPKSILAESMSKDWATSSWYLPLYDAIAGLPSTSTVWLSAAPAVEPPEPPWPERLIPISSLLLLALLM